MRSSSFTGEAQQRWPLAAVATVASLASIIVYLLGTLQTSQDAVMDQSFQLAGSRIPPADIVAVDNTALQRIDFQMPISRSY